MDRDAAVAALPEVYAELLRLREAGTDRARIAALLEVEVEALDLLLRVAEAKLALLLAAPQLGEHDGEGAPRTPSPRPE